MRTILLLLSLTLLAGCTVAKTEPDRKKEDQPAKKNLPTRAEFNKSVDGKTPREVLKILGKPESTGPGGDDIDSPEYASLWHYPDAVVDQVTNKPKSAWVRFRAGKVTEVQY
jgi:hypothetical protein